MKNDPEEKQVLRCSKEEFLKRFFGLIENDQFDIDSVGQILEKFCNYYHLVSFDAFRKQRKMSEDAMWERLDAKRTIYLLFNEQ